MSIPLSVGGGPTLGVLGLNTIRMKRAWPEPDALMAALADLAESLRRMTGIACEFSCPRPVLVHDQHGATNLYRIAQEAVNNAVRHGKPKRIRISLIQRGKGPIALEIRDDGLGIGKRHPASRGLGLEIMTCRAADIGAVCSVAPGVPRGVVVRCVWPGGDAQGKRI